MDAVPDDGLAQLRAILRGLLHEHAATSDDEKAKHLADAVRDVRELIARLEHKC